MKITVEIDDKKYTIGKEYYFQGEKQVRHGILEQVLELEDKYQFNFTESVTGKKYHSSECMEEHPIIAKYINKTIKCSNKKQVEHCYEFFNEINGEGEIYDDDDLYYIIFDDGSSRDGDEDYVEYDGLETVLYTDFCKSEDIVPKVNKAVNELKDVVKNEVEDCVKDFASSYKRNKYIKGCIDQGLTILDKLGIENDFREKYLK